MSTGEEIYRGLTTVSDPASYVSGLSDDDLRKLLDELELLPAGGGFPVLAGAVADQEVQNRFKVALSENHESHELHE